MPTLDEEIGALSELDALRMEARGFIERGARGLLGSTYAAHPGWEGPRVGSARDEYTLLLRALHVARAQGVLTDELSCEAFEAVARDFVGDSSAWSGNSYDGGQTPILSAGRALEVLAATPGLALSKAAVYCFYRVLRELFSSEPPLWVMGAARAGAGCKPTAFVTGECCRGVVALVHALQGSAELCVRLRGVHLRRARIAAIPRLPRQWVHVERERLNMSLDIGLSWMRCRTIFIVRDVVVNDIDTTAACLGAQLGGAVASVRAARGDIQAARAAENDGVHRDSAHLEALDAVDLLASSLEEAAVCLRAADWEGAALHLREAAEGVNRHLEPSRNFIGGILDHELAAAAGPDRDLPEMVFAAVAFGLLHGAWDDPRLAMTAGVVVANLSEGGRLPAGRPFQVQGEGFELHPVGAEVVRGLAALLRRTHREITPGVVRSLLRLFRTHQRDVPGGLGWSSEAPVDPRKASWWSSALSVIALERVVRMLDGCINERIAAHFSTTHPARLEVDLDDAFYPDYDLVRADRSSIAIHLQRMRAHVLGISRGEFRDPLNSLVLYGPPGTGKTTFAEALARSCSSRFIHVTPSDIVLGGAEHAEYRARMVFSALAMLTDSVILFDEFDPLLRRRLADDGVPSNIFELLTPGMLPKLERLHDAARDQRVAYFLATNLVGALDNAAIRDGRFDQKLGTYPPDLISRLGRLLIEKQTATARQEGRLLRVCALTHDAPMSTLGRKGWFTADAHPKDGCAQAYIDNARKAPRWPTPEFSEIGTSGEGKHAEFELAEWLWSRTLDWQLVGGPAPGGNLQVYLKASGWGELRGQLKRGTVSWAAVTDALASRPEWEPFFEWVTAELRRKQDATTSTETRSLAALLARSSNHAGGAHA